VAVKNEEGTINESTKSVGKEKCVPLQFDKPGLKSFLLSAYKGQMTYQKIYKHAAFKFSQGTIRILRKQFIAQNFNLLLNFLQKPDFFVKTKEFLFQHYILTEFLCCM
jgi:hypothetical protein